MESLVAVAKIVRPRGLRGELIADLLTDFPERFDGLEKVIALLPDAGREELTIENSWFQQNRIVLKFVGIDSIEAAATLRDAEICVPEDEAVELEEGEFFDWQLVGCNVETLEGEHVGRVRELMRTGGTENLVVENDGRDYLIPFAESICREVDVKEKRIVVDLPEGLLEF